MVHILKWPSTNSVLILKIPISYWDSYPSSRIIFPSETNSVKSEYRKQMCRYLFVGVWGFLIGWGDIWRHFVLAFKFFCLCVYTTNLLASWLISEHAATDNLLSAKNSSKLLSRNRLKRRSSQLLQGEYNPSSSINPLVCSVWVKQFPIVYMVSTHFPEKNMQLRTLGITQLQAGTLKSLKPTSPPLCNSFVNYGSQFSTSNSKPQTRHPILYPTPEGATRMWAIA